MAINPTVSPIQALDQPATQPPTQPITILLCALGGEGGGVLSEWLFDAALRAGHSAQATSIPGVAQRTGATTYYVEIWPQPDPTLAGRQPVFSLNPVPGAIDLLVSSELLETVRQIGNGMASAQRTQVISATSRALTVAEKMAPADGRMDDARLLATVQRHSRACELLDLAGMARQAGTVISAVMLGVIAASGVLPLARQVYEDTIRAAGKGVDASLRGFALGFDAVRQRRQQLQAAQQLIAQALPAAPPPAPSPAPSPTQPSATPTSPAPQATTRPLPDAWRQRFPAELHPVLTLGHDRLVDYQGSAYAQRYADRLDRVLAAERAADPEGRHQWALTAEAARWLALWMAFDDIVRVAALKAAASRWTRLQREAGAAPGELLRVYDHFKPGVPEVAALLPAGLARRLQAWDARRQANGQPPWAMPIRLGRHTVTGLLALRLLAALKGLRPLTSRFADEQAQIDAWLAAVCRASRHGWVLGHELAQCGRLNKGYGSTHDRGRQRLQHVLQHLAPAEGATGVDAPARAAAVAALRQAALADEGGVAFDQALRAQGVPGRVAVGQPIRWYKRRPGGGGVGVGVKL